jgi:hypothetical protein
MLHVNGTAVWTTRHIVLCHSPFTVRNHYKVTWPWSRFSCLLALCRNSIAKGNLSCTQKTFFLGCPYMSNILRLLRFSFVTLDTVFTWRQLPETNETQYSYRFPHIRGGDFSNCFLLLLPSYMFLGLLIDRKDDGNTLFRNADKHIRLHGVIFQKTTLFTVTVLRPSNLIFIGFIFAYAVSKFLLKISSYKQ